MTAPSASLPRLAFVLDDELKFGAFVCKMLDLIGVPSRRFAESLPFLTDVRTDNPDLVILDLALAESDAVEIIRKLEVLKFAGGVLLVSGCERDLLAEIERIGSAHGLRMLPSLQKPFRSCDLEEALCKIADLTAPVPHERAQAPLSRRQPADLALALENNWLELWYQPKIDLHSLKVCGAEALVRMRQPGEGVIAPIDFLPPAGDPLYKPLSTFVLTRATSDWVTFANHGFPLKLAVNVPASVLSAPGFVDLLRRAIPRDRKFPGLILEITEDEIIHDPAWIQEIAAQARLHNASISIDDFGSAYASLARVKDLPFSEIKLDHSFVSGCASDPLKRNLCETVADLAHRFEATACAEGVETEDDLRCLVDLAFDTAQGYLFAKPMPPAQLLAMLGNQPTWHLEPAVKSVARAAS
jgi:EAL domain-containing protein (putative c-di-GMP-specific phosphodiesterase class I)/FixJ family two-component response regulator